MSANEIDKLKNETKIKNNYNKLNASLAYYLIEEQLCSKQGRWLKVFQMAGAGEETLTEKNLK